MNTDGLFKPLEPPRGGAEHFARRLDEAASSSPGIPRWRGWALAGAACAVVALVVAVVLLRAPNDASTPTVATAPTIYDSPAFDRLLGRPLPVEPLTAAVNKQPIRVTELESQNSKVKIYLLD